MSAICHETLPLSCWFMPIAAAIAKITVHFAAVSSGTFRQLSRSSVRRK